MTKHPNRRTLNSNKASYQSLLSSSGKKYGRTLKAPNSLSRRQGRSESMLNASIILFVLKCSSGDRFGPGRT